MTDLREYEAELRRRVERVRSSRWLRFKRKVRREWSRRNHVAVGLTLGVALIAGISAITLLYAPGPDSPPSASAPAPTSSPGAEPTVEPYTPTLADAMSRLSDSARPFNILILGDSTSVEPEIGWHVLMMEWLSEETDRAWVLHQWSTDLADYAPPVERGDGTAAPLVLWNASAGEKDFDYVAGHRETMLRTGAPVDLVIVNHGHNVEPEQDYYEVGVPLIDSIHRQLGDAALVMTAQNPEKGDAARGHRMALIVDMLDVYAEAHALPVIDVYAAYARLDDPDAWLDILEKHPTPAGYRLWFRETRDLLAPTLP